jgi:aspartate 1-decarboxylase
MQFSLLYSKLHRATVTQADLNYEGSISICPTLIQAAKLLLHQRVDVYNITNGARFETYVIQGQAQQIQVNGAAARLVQPGDLLIIAAFALFTPEEAASWKPTVVLLNQHNQVQDP